MTVTSSVESPVEAVARIAPIIREHADSSEQQRTLARPIVDAMIEAGLFRGLTPTALGGSEVGPVEWFRTVEAGARIDGSAGWCLFINGSAGLFGATLPDDKARELLGDPQFVAGGTLFPFGRAQATDGGYTISGRWPYASGCRHVNWHSVFCIVMDGDQPRQSPQGGPEIRTFLAPISKYEVIDTWYVSGLVGSGSHDVVADDIFVEEAFALPLSIRGTNSYYQGPLYRMPLITLFGLPIAAVALGIAQHAIDTTLEVAQAKVPAGPNSLPLRQRPTFHAQLAEAISAVASARAWLHQALDQLYQSAQADEPASIEARNECWMAAGQAVRASSRATELMYLAAGGTANYLSSPLQRCMRDMHAITQHAVTSSAAWESCGSVAVGNPPPNPFLLL